MWILIAYIFYFMASTASTLQRRHIALRRDNDKGQLTFAFHIGLIAFLLSSILVIFKHPEINQSWLVLLALAATAGFFSALAVGAQYIAQRHVEAGLTSLIGNIYTPVTIVLSTVLLSEGLKSKQIIGTVLLLVSVVLVSRKHRLTKWRFDSNFWLMVISGVSLGFCLVAERELIKINGITTATWFSWGASALFLGIAARADGKKSQYDRKDTLVTGVLRFLQMLSWVILITIVANLSIVSAVTTFKIVTVFAAAAVFLHERQYIRRKIIGSFIATIGLLLMI